MSKREITEAMESESELFQDSAQRMFEHLSANGVNLKDDSAIILGADIKMNPTTETVIGNDRAAAMMSRDYRAGFEVPKLHSENSTS